MNEHKKYKSSVKLMRSYNYCHFEVCLGSDEDMTLAEINEMRKEAARLVDRAVRQYCIAKVELPFNRERALKKDKLKRKVQAIKENFSKSEWTPEQEALVKSLEDADYEEIYNYQDDWDDKDCYQDGWR